VRALPFHPLVQFHPSDLRSMWYGKAARSVVCIEHPVRMVLDELPFGKPT